MLALDSIGRRYGRLPSEVIGLTDEFKAFAVNLWAHNAGVQNDGLNVWRGKNRGRRS